MHVPIAKFGNLAQADANRVTDAVERQATDWPAPRLHLQGGLARTPEGDSSVWVKLAGDLDELNEVARGVSRVAQGLHLFVDRRVFRPELRLGTIDDHATEARLEELLAALAAFESPHWLQASLMMLVPVDLGPGQPPYKVHRDILLGPAATH